ncbi:hypothetical protein [Pantoea stewartii]|nr:hypothetical protein [Pantoea stewartii]
MTMRRSDREAMQKRNEFDRTVQRNENLQRNVNDFWERQAEKQQEAEDRLKKTARLVITMQRGESMSKASSVRLLPEHRDKILAIQAVEAEKSPLGVKPTIGAIASALIQRGLDDLFSQAREKAPASGK